MKKPNLPDLLCSFQGLLPEFAYVLAPWSGYQPQVFRILDYTAYYRRIRTTLALGASAKGGRWGLPVPVFSMM